MSIGAPSTLGTLLIQRLDAMLGTTLSQQANLVSGASPRAITQPGQPENPPATRSPTQHVPGESVDRATRHDRRQTTASRPAREIPLDNLLGRQATSRGLTPSAPTTLGYAARIILALLHEFPDSNRNIVARRPLIPSPETHRAAHEHRADTRLQPGRLALPGANPSTQLASELARALTQSIRHSGLFYESHLAQLALGERPATSLRLEPQGQLPPQPPRTGHAPPPAPASGAPAPPPENPVPTHETSGRGHPDRANPPPLEPAGDSHRAPLAELPGIDPDARLLVRQQLEVLAQQALIWQGEAWPGASLELDIQRHPAKHGEPAEADAEDHWATRITLHLPRLGEIRARLILQDAQLVLRLVAPQASQPLRAALGALRARLVDQGLQPTQMTVSAHAHEG